MEKKSKQSSKPYHSQTSPLTRHETHLASLSGHIPTHTHTHTHTCLIMSLVNKVAKTFRLLRWSTICAILFYMFFIGLILHSTTTKLQHTLKSHSSNSPHSHHQPTQNQPQAASLLQQHGGGSGNSKKPEAGLADTLQNMRLNTLQGRKKINKKVGKG